MIKIHCDNGNDFRLARVLVSVFTQADKLKIADVNALGDLRHHGGMLTATYKAKPSEMLKEAVDAAWNAENEIEVQHVVNLDY
jgi:hypothetical protein